MVHEVDADAWACTHALAVFWKDDAMVQVFGLAQLIDIRIPAPDPDAPAQPESEENDKPEDVEVDEVPRMDGWRPGQYL